MYSISSLFRQYISQPDRLFEVKAEIYDVTYGNDAVMEYEIDDSLIPVDDFTLGTFMASKLDLAVKTQDSIPSNSKVVPYVRLNGSSGYSEWLKQGEFYIDSRSFRNGVYHLSCYDKAILGDQYFESALTYPATMQEVLVEMCGKIGLPIDSSVYINPSYMVQTNPANYKVREIIGYIAMMHGAAAKVNKDGKLIFIKFVPGSIKNQIGPSDYIRVEQTNPIKAYTKVVVAYSDNGDSYTAGEGDELHTLNLFNPFATKTMVDNILSGINGFSYAPMTLEWRGNPAFEPGDFIEVTQPDGTKLASVIMQNKIMFSGGLKIISTAPSYTLAGSEFKYTGSKEPPSLKEVDITDDVLNLIYDDDTTSSYNIQRDETGRIIAFLDTYKELIINYADSLAKPEFQPQFISARVNPDGKSVVVIFDKVMENPVGHEHHFEVKIGSTTATITSTTEGENGNEVALNLYETILPSDSATVSYTYPATGGLVTLQMCPLLSFSAKPITNMATAAPQFVSASTDSTGYVVTITFDKVMADPAGYYQGFDVTGNGTNDKFPCGINLNGSDNHKIDIKLFVAADPGEVLAIDYNKWNIMSADGAFLNSFTGKPISNNVT